MVTTSKDNWVVGIDALHHNPYDGHTLKHCIEQAKWMTGWQPTNAYCDRGYRGATRDVPGTTVHLTNKKKRSLSRLEWKWLRRRSAIEPVFGHLKSDNRLERNPLQGKEGDRINAILAGCGFNLRKLLRAFLLPIFNWLFGNPKTEKSEQTTLILNRSFA